ncbi:hypothetical protein CEXT_764171 [Caerostris extrusa]|uniref:Uncharacterized protein n=1 Tax=Caerostris extrusa TaxID=172846 RepID=A0AAV4X351_CAEEX|nr:hypothetical protein CEXT_764171 [Caerostris extrusa]
MFEIQHVNKPINKQRVHLNRLVKVATVSELGYPEEVLVRKDHSLGVGQSPPQAVDDHSPPNSPSAQIAVSHRDRGMQWVL